MKNKKVHIIFFTYKRAIMLDAAITSLIQRFKSISYPISVIYHYNKNHKKSYNYLKKKYKYKLKFYERKPASLLKRLYLFLNPINLFFLLRWPNIIKKYNNFKDILEKIIKNSKHEYIMLCPDDIFFYKNFIIPKEILNKLDKDPSDIFLRLAYGKNIKSFSKKAKVKSYVINEMKFVEWNRLDGKASQDMKYSFHVEAAVYNRKFLLKFFKKFIYHNPITLEANGLKISKFYNYLKKTISPSERVAASYQINTVQNDNIYRDKYRVQIYSKLLDNLYLKGYNLVHKINSKQKKDNDVYPKEVYLVNNKKKYLI